MPFFQALECCAFPMSATKWISKDVEDAISAIIKARRIYIHAKGAALSMAQLLKFRLTRFGLSLTILPPGSSELFEEMNFITPEDLLILFGFQNIPREARVLLDYREKTDTSAKCVTDCVSHIVTM